MLISIVLQVITNYYHVDLCGEREGDVPDAVEPGADTAEREPGTKNRSKAVEGRPIFYHYSHSFKWCTS